MPIQSLINDPVTFLTELLISLPAILIALVLHEVAHGYVAYRCGDPTAKMMGRLTLNPLRHLDPLGAAMMLLAGIGWAKPVPVNPRNYRHGRRDDLLVSIAGITMNLILCLSFYLILQIFLTVLLLHPAGTAAVHKEALYLPNAGYYYGIPDLYRHAYGIGTVVTEVWGDALGILYRILAQIAVTNLCLAAFNLLPVPPLDGYHVLNDLLLKKSFFADPRVVRAASSALFLVVILTDWLDIALSWIVTNALGALGSAGWAIVQALGAL